MFAVGLGALLFVPVFKSLTGLPPFLGMLLGLGILWLLTDAIHYGETDRQRLKVPQALSRIDTQGVLFFLGILLSVGRYAKYVTSFFSSTYVVSVQESGIDILCFGCGVSEEENFLSLMRLGMLVGQFGISRDIEESGSIFKRKYSKC